MRERAVEVLARHNNGAFSNAEPARRRQRVGEQAALAGSPLACAAFVGCV